MNTRRLWERRQGSDTEPDSDAPPAGSAWTGTGRPLEIGTGLLRREYCDGMGLRSPGRWRPSSHALPVDRTLASHCPALLRHPRRSSAGPSSSLNSRAGRCEPLPFNPVKIETLWAELRDLLSSSVHPPVEQAGGPAGPHRGLPVSSCSASFRQRGIPTGPRWGSSPAALDSGSALKRREGQPCTVVK